VRGRSQGRPVSYAWQTGTYHTRYSKMWWHYQLHKCESGNNGLDIEFLGDGGSRQMLMLRLYGAVPSELAPLCMLTACIEKRASSITFTP
jgi:hypothetical protein